MFVDSASHFQRLYGTRDKSAWTIFGVVQRFVADMGVPRVFRTDNGSEYTNSAFVEYFNSLQIRREVTAPYMPQEHGPAESGLSWAIKAGHVARIEVNRLFPNVHLEILKGIRDPDDSSLRMVSCGPREDSTAPRPRRTAACSPRTRCYSGAARRCRSCRSASRRTIAPRGKASWTARRDSFIFSISTTVPAR